MAFWAIFLGTVMVPLMVLAWDVGRLFYARGEIQKAADAAALAAAREVDVPHYMLTGEVLLHQGAVGFATHYAERNITYLPSTGISPLAASRVPLTREYNPRRSEVPVGFATIHNPHKL